MLIFLIAVERGLARIKAERKNGVDKYEKKAFLKQVDRNFRSFKDTQVRYVDGDRPLPDVSKDVDRIIDLFLSERMDF